MTEAPRSATSPTSLLPDYGPPLSLADAKRVAEAAEAEAEARGWHVVIAIFDSTAHLVLLHRRDQSNLGAIDLAQRKADTSVRFRRPTKTYEDIVAGGGVRLLSVSSDIIALEGGLPLIQGGRIVGSIGVSGMASNEDALIASAGARALSD